MQSRAWVPAWTALGLLLRVALVLRGGGVLAFFDERDYDGMALTVLDGRGLQLYGRPSAERPPGQPLFLAAVYAIAGHRPLVAELVQAALLCAVPFAVFRLAQRTSRHPAVPAVAAAMAAMHPALAYSSATLYGTALTTAGLCAGICLAVEVCVGARLVRAAGSGAALAVAALTTPWFTVLIALVALLVFRSGKRRAAAVLAAAGLLPVALWIARNAVQVGAPTMGTNIGYNLLLGANDRATPRSGNWIEPPPIDLVAIRGDVQRDAARARLAWEWIREHPFRWTALALGRAAAVFDSVGHPRTRGIHDDAWARLAGWALLPWVVLGVAGALRAWRSPAGGMIALAFFTVLLSCALTIAKPRFRFPCDPLLAVFAAEMVADLAAGLARRRSAAGFTPPA